MMEIDDNEFALRMAACIKADPRIIIDEVIGCEDVETLCQVILDNLPSVLTIDPIEQFPGAKDAKYLGTTDEGQQFHVDEKESPVSPKISTEVKGEVTEYHFRCVGKHEFSLLAKAELEIGPLLYTAESAMDCPVVGCGRIAFLQGQNPAEISKNPADLLVN